MFKAPEDFIVEELPLYEPSQIGTHTFFAVSETEFDHTGSD